VIWFGQEPLIGDSNYTTEGLKAMDRWLTAVNHDHRDISLERKVAQDRPDDVHDRCSRIDGVERVAVPGVGPVCELKQVQTRFGTPAMAAGESIATNINRCQLQPLRRSDYPVTFTDDEWTQLEQTFPTGVCDWSERGVDQRNTTGWLSYERGDHVV
jgi:Tannase-like family of unknown function (DUF6351)